MFVCDTMQCRIYNVVINIIKLVQCSRLLFVLILLTLDCHILLWSIVMTYDDPMTLFAGKQLLYLRNQLRAYPVCVIRCWYWQHYCGFVWFNCECFFRKRYFAQSVFLVWVFPLQFLNVNFTNRAFHNARWKRNLLNEQCEDTLSGYSTLGKAAVPGYCKHSTVHCVQT
jgi:hypothetical protein